jgi:hypothetical protein
MKKKLTEKESQAKASKKTTKSMPINKPSSKKVYPENKRTRVVDSPFLGTKSGVPKKLPNKNKTK